MSRVTSQLLIVLLLGGGVWSLCPQAGAAQAPPSVERVRERIQVIRGVPSGVPVREEEPRAPRVDSLPRRSTRTPISTAEPELTPRDLRQFEERLLRRVREVVRRQVALSLDQQRQPRPDQRPADTFYPPPASAPTVIQYDGDPGAAPDTAAALTVPPPDTARRPPPPAVDSVARPVAPVARDTIVQRQVVQVRRSLLETGLFRAFEVNFASGQSTLLPRAERSLNAIGEVLQQYPALRLEIAGHTDAVGSDAANQKLSQERASAVRDYLVDQFALSADRFDVRGYGESRPIATNQTSVGRELNRRVEFVVLNPEEAERILDVSEPSAPE